MELTERLTPILSSCRLLAARLCAEENRPDLIKSLEEVINEFLDSLKSLLENNVDGRNPQSVSIILRGYKSCRALATAQVVFIQKFIDPLVKLALLGPDKVNILLFLMISTNGHNLGTFRTKHLFVAMSVVFCCLTCLRKCWLNCLICTANTCWYSWVIQLILSMENPPLE